MDAGHASAFALAVLFALGTTWLALRVSWVIGWLDHPEARKLHTSATALLGGAGVIAAAVLAGLVVNAMRPGTIAAPAPELQIGAGLLLALGLWDDRFGLGPAVKLPFQIVAALLLIRGTGVPDIGLPGPLTTFLAVLMAVSLMNACNFLDNMNGMLAGIAAITLAAFGALLAGAGRGAEAAMLLALAGACVGFLPWNFPRAKIFLGDAGSLVLGYSLAASLLLGLQAVPRGWNQLGPPLMLAYPAFDMIFVIIRRPREGRRITQGGRDHTNHRLASLIQCPIRTVLLIWCSTAALCASGFALSREARPLPALLLWGLWTLLLILTGRRLSSVPLAPKA